MTNIIRYTMEYRFKWVKTETTTATDIVTSAADPKLIHAQCVSFERQKMAENRRHPTDLLRHEVIRGNVPYDIQEWGNLW